MIKYFIILQLLLLTLSAIEIDYKALEDIISKNPSAIKEKILLSKYYMKQGSNEKALILLNEVLKKEPKNKPALLIKARAKKQQSFQELFKEAGLSKPIKAQDAQKRLDSYYTENNYQFYSMLYQALVDIGINLKDSYHIKAADIYLQDTRYKQSKKAIDKVKQKNSANVEKISADICYYTGKYRCCAKLYKKLYSSSYSVNISIKLINSYIYLKNITKAQRVYNFMHRKHPNNQKLSNLGNKIRALKNSYLSDTKHNYEKNKNFKTLRTYANILYSSGKVNKTLKLLHAYNKDNATNESLILEAKYLIWSDKTQKALNILRDGSLVSDLQTKLMLGQIYSWQRVFYKAKINLDEVIKRAKDKNLLFDAKKARAFVYMWEKKRYHAKELFKKLYKQRPSDIEIKEALMELNHNYKGLIKIYKKRVKNSNTSMDIRRLSDLYKLNKQASMAIKYLKIYVKNNPDDLDATKDLATLLIKNKKYYEGFGYLEYYSSQKNTYKSKFLLAQYYYWNGFSKEALDVLGSILQNDVSFKEDLPSMVGDDYKSKALQLKSEILKVSPRFTLNNDKKTIDVYFNNLSKKQLFLADTLYFNEHYKSAITYYENYLKSKPNDYNARYKYAYALENAKEYAKAEGEFSLILLKRGDDELKYHYAYNMMKNYKLKESKNLLLELKKKTYTKIDPKLSAFLESWRDSWQSLNFSKYSLHYDKKYLNNQVWLSKKKYYFKNLKNLKKISITIYDPISKKIDTNHYKIKFYQKYKTTTSSDKGYKTLILNCDENKTSCKITKESWKRGKYKKVLLLTPYIDKALQENVYLQAHPLALKSKKKILLSKRRKKSIMIYT